MNEQHTKAVCRHTETYLQSQHTAYTPAKLLYHDVDLRTPLDVTGIVVEFLQSFT